MSKGDKLLYGYSSTVVTDEHGIALSVDTHAANTSEMGRFANDIADAPIKAGQTLLYDKGAASKANQAFLRDKQIHDGIMRKKPRGKAMPHWQKVRNKLILSNLWSRELSAQ